MSLSPQGLPVHQDMKAGIIVSQKNLVLQMVRRTSAGNYTCKASNALGTTISNVVPLSIRCECLCVCGGDERGDGRVCVCLIY